MPSAPLASFARREKLRSGAAPLITSSPSDNDRPIALVNSLLWRGPIDIPYFLVKRGSSCDRSSADVDQAHKGWQAMTSRFRMSAGPAFSRRDQIRFGRPLE